MVAVRGATPSIWIWKLSPARREVSWVRSTDWFGLTEPCGRRSASGTLEPDGSMAMPDPVETPSAPPNCLVQLTVPEGVIAAAKALVTLAMLRDWPAKVPVVEPVR